MSTEPAFSFGIEEEYHLVDRTTRDLAAAPRATGMSEAEALRAVVDHLIAETAEGTTSSAA